MTDEAQVAALPRHLPHDLDAVVNNAGVALLGTVEALVLDDVRRQFEVNVIGQIALTQAVLPLFRTGRGRVVFISSVNGRMSVPMEGAYCASKFAVEASKFAVEGLADALRVELRPWGIPVSLIEPGLIDTQPWREIHRSIDEMHERMDRDHRDLYAVHTSGLRRSASVLQRRTAPVDTAARTVQRALTARRSRARYLVGKDARAMIAMQAVTPSRVKDDASARIAGEVTGFE